MDQSDCTSVVCKVSVVDENGGLILDTLVNPEAVITRSMVRLHGVRMSWLSDAPTVTQVRQHLQEVCGKSVFIGHSVKHDLNALSLVNVHCIDTYFYEDMTQDDSMLWASRNPKKLKDLASLFLNAQIQESVHSSVSTNQVELQQNANQSFCFLSSDNRRESGYGSLQGQTGVLGDEKAVP